MPVGMASISIKKPMKFKLVIFFVLRIFIINAQDDPVSFKTPIFSNPEKMPIYKNGSSKDLQFDLLKRLIYPIDACVEGIIVIEFTVNKKGMVIEPRIKKGLVEGIDTQLLELILEYEFYPGEINGIVESMVVRLPLKIKL
jgi:hypothetical protein